MPGSVSSIDDFSDTASTSSSENERRLIQEEWEESLEQLQQLVTVLLMPFIGKWLGRKYSYWLYGRYTRFGLSKAFFFGKGFVSS